MAHEVCVRRLSHVQLLPAREDVDQGSGRGSSKTKDRTLNISLAVAAEDERGTLTLLAYNFS